MEAGGCISFHGLRSRSPWTVDSGQWTVDSLVYYFNRAEGGMRRSSSRMRIRRAKRSTTIHHSTPTTFHQWTARNAIIPLFPFRRRRRLLWLCSFCSLDDALISITLNRLLFGIGINKKKKGNWIECQKLVGDGRPTLNSAIGKSSAGK